MHPNPAFRHDDRALLEALVDEIGFGMVFAQTPDGPRVAHTALLSTGDGAVQFHLARGNALAKWLAGGTALVVVNSICGCAAGRMRPAVRMALQNGAKPDRAYSVFAGQEKEATERARSYFTGYPPSSPSIALFRDGQLVYFMQRRDIESREAPAIAAELKAAFDRFCGTNVAV